MFFTEQFNYFMIPYLPDRGIERVRFFMITLDNGGKGVIVMSYLT